MVFETVKRNSTGTSVVVLQTVLRMMQYLGKNGLPLEIDGHAGENTIYAINTFQRKARAYGYQCGTNGKNNSKFDKTCWKILLGDM